jgi:hypothetical protein
MIRRFSIFEKHDIDPYGEEDWEEKMPDLYYAEVSVDNIEISPCYIDMRWQFRRTYDNYILNNGEKYNLEFIMDLVNHDKFFILEVPFEKPNYTKLIYIYKRDVNRERILHAMNYFINHIEGHEKIKEKFANIIRIFENDLLSTEMNGKIINLI